MLPTIPRREYVTAILGAVATAEVHSGLDVPLHATVKGDIYVVCHTTDSLTERLRLRDGQ